MNVVICIHNKLFVCAYNKMKMIRIRIFLNIMYSTDEKKPTQIKGLPVKMFIVIFNSKNTQYIIHVDSKCNKKRTNNHLGQ